MGILDDAIREHLELKRQQGAADSELQQIEAEAFGPSERPGAEAGAATLPEAEAEAPTEFMPAADQLAPAPEEPQSAAPAESPPAEEEHPALEHDAVPEQPPDADAAGSIGDQPTELYDVDAEIASAQSSPSPEELYEEEVAEPRLPPPEPLETGPEAEEEAVEVTDGEDFFDEQSLSDELDQALDAVEPPPAEEAAVEEVEEPGSAEAEEPAAEEPEPEDAEEDVLEETPEFLQDTPEHDRLWFEQKPPKDFDFDD